MLTTAEVEARVGVIGRELLTAARERKTSFWARERWDALVGPTTAETAEDGADVGDAFASLRI